MITPLIGLHTLNGNQVLSYGESSSSPIIEDVGRGRIVNGVASIVLEARFSRVIDQRNPYAVFVTPEGDCNGLYVTEKTQGGFTVRELRSGRSTVDFSYRIVAHPFASATARLPDASPRRSGGRTNDYFGYRQLTSTGQGSTTSMGIGPQVEFPRRLAPPRVVKP